MSIHKTAIGVLLQIRAVDSNGAPVDLSGTTEKAIRVEKPDGTTTEYTASFTTDGTDGWLEYTTTTSDAINMAGGYQYQARCKWSATKEHFTDIVAFEVEEILEVTP
jgi:hypothetical protein